VTGDSLQNVVNRFIAEELGARVERLTLTTQLFRDLGVDGDDGCEFMAAFGRRFEVDMSEFRPRLHFGPEAGCNPLVLLVLLVCRPSNLRFIPITVGNLVEAARSGRWHTPNRDASGVGI
jgi:Protein of unknown function (DUF1493)